jgi:calnexin
MIPPQEIDDPTDKKPSDWDDREKIPDPDAVKPEDWDEEAPMMIPDDSAVKPEGWLDDGPENIPDPDAVKPDDWEEDEDGTWEAPLIPNPICNDVGCGEWTPPLIKNPAYKGKWNPPMIDNQNYMGVWSPKRIANPAYFELKDGETVYSHLQNIEAIGFELWSMSKDILFDNVVITQDLTSAASFASQGYVKKVENERKELGLDRFHPWIEYFIELANERPYLWALYVVALVMPFVICAAICVRPKSSSRPPKDETSKKKKTDEPSPDDPPLEDPNATKSKDDVSFVAPEDDGDDKAETQEDKIEEIQENTEEIQEIVDELKKEEEEEGQFQATKPQRRGKRGPKRED